MAEIVKEVNDKLLRKINKILSRGGVIAFPTETVYALAVDASNDEAVKKIYALKERENCKPLSILVSDMCQANTIVDVDERAEKLSVNFFPGPLTIILNKREYGPISRYVNAGSDTVGLRIPSHLLTLKILKSYGRTLVATSANISGNNADSMDPKKIIEIFGGIDLIVDLGETEHKNFSTVIDLSSPEANVVREGVIPSGKILKCLES